jgi:hypothetical protein
MIYTLLLLLAINMVSTSLVNRKTGSDGSVHLLLIQLIKDNGNRFISYVEPFLIGDIMGYPQLYHWIMSFIDNNKLEFTKQVTPLIGNLISLTLHIIFSILVIQELELPSIIIVMSILLFLSNSMIFNKDNARNMGLSGRSIGLIMGQIWIIVLYKYLITGHILYLAALSVINLLIILTSQFTAQYILMASIIISALYLKTGLILSLIFGGLSHYLLFPDHFKNYWKFQWRHKKYYYSYAAKAQLILSRSSIWRDLIYDIWKKISINRNHGIIYGYKNPVVMILTSQPILLMIIFHSFTESLIFETIIQPQQIMTIATINLVTITIFVLTSFKKTRFLGEPERYMDFASSTIAILAAILYREQQHIVVVATLFGIIKIMVDYAINKRTFVDTVDPAIRKMKNVLSTITDRGGMRLFSNNIEITKRMLTTKSKYFYGWMWYLEDYYNLHEIYMKPSIIKQESIFSIVQDWRINYMIIDDFYINEPLICENINYEYREISRVDHYRIIQVCLKS